jgi:ribose/xylose/arabinose/galactoside ABC-type transport system permease subunit
MSVTADRGAATDEAGWGLAGLRDRLRRSENTWTYVPLLVAIFALSAYAASQSDLYLTERNIQVLLNSIAVLGLLTVGMTLLLVAGQLDLSVGANATLASIIGAKLISSGSSDGVAVVVMLLVPAAISGVVAVIVVLTRVQPFILTLGLLSVLQAISLIETGQRPVPIGSRLQGFDTADFLTIPLPFWIFVGALLVGAVILRFTRFGRAAYAVGSNEQAAYMSGVPVNLTKISLFVLSGFLCGLAGLLLLARLGAGDAASGQGLELDAIAAAIIGGCSLLGGRGSMLGSFLGVLLLGVIQNSLTLLDVSSFYQRMVLGGLLMFAVTATAVAEMRRGSAESIADYFRRVLGGRREGSAQEDVAAPGPDDRRAEGRGPGPPDADP